MAASDHDEMRAEILRIDEEWAAAAAAGKDVERVLSFWADDAMVFPPGAPTLVGKDAIREFVAGSFRTPGFSITWKTTDLTVSPAGDFAYGVGSNRVAYQGPDGSPIAVHGKAVTLWRRDPSGWKCVIDIWNDDPAS